MTVAVRGHVVRCERHAIEARVPAVRLGERGRILASDRTIWATIAALDGGRVTLAPLGDPAGIACGDPVIFESGAEPCVLGFPLLGRAVDGLGLPLDGRPAPRGARVASDAGAPRLEERLVGAMPLWTGIRAIDGLLVLARGARIGIFGPPGSGKSTLLERIARGADADAVVVALVGERGAEARARLAEVDDRSTLVCAASDRSPGERLAAGDLAMAQAERLRGCGLDVLVIFDSLARYANAAREIALAGGESVGRGGYPPSAFARLAQLTERAGCTGRGSITLIATVLSEAGDPADPLAEAARSFLDGHLNLSRRLAERGAFPAIDLPRSVSRTMSLAAGPRHGAAASRVRAALARLDETREARELGLVAADPALTRALAAEEALEGFLLQGAEISDSSETLCSLEALADTL